MTPTESRMLNEFLLQLRQVQGIQKDPEAAALIADAALAQPDALYLLVQRALLQDQALASASARIAVLEAQAVPAVAVAPSSFLDGGNNAWGRSASPVSARAYNAPATPASVPMASAAVASAPAAMTQAPAGAGFFGGGGGNFLGTMAATAAGVAGGALLFQGIGSMMGHHGAAAPSTQSNAFSSMADSVDKPAAAAAVDPVASSDMQSANVDDSAGDIDFGDDDAMA
ncbi:DUF2076 domain-containing protein [Actimicrobium sp. CCI2.3]|uniref:DUF2076 domain-containing protein n=1 Tax=Actimicrobium sp. CCI2.3 TaxID=3048616 RepID=UPI002AB4443A|nr:DUF2076 family protein [Actimicrobium sp. CCI2.3]MDY7575913.1 DUF2076 family protein [Actimicrobium sp. CCI2.3]MEB0023181.1 DUF2076 family protein [Actimicrobium sp. CCI2.3]